MGDLGLIPGSGRYPGEGNGNPLQYCGLENSVDRGAWRATVHEVAKSRHSNKQQLPILRIRSWSVVLECKELGGWEVMRSESL